MHRSCSVLLLLAAVVLAGCANPYRSYYVSTLDKWPGAGALLAAVPAGTEPKLVAATDLRADITTMLENGYLMIGKSTFRSSRINESQALELAREVGAEVVLASQEYMNTVTQSVPMTQWLPERRLTTTERSTYQAHPDSAPVVRERVITQTIQGESYIEYVPETVDYYNYSATFWRKSIPLAFGVLVQALDEPTRQRLQTNRGVMVKVVVNRSPAFTADILRGDIITQFNGEPVNDPPDFFAKIRAHAGRPVTVRIIRGTAARDISLTLR